MDKKSQILFPPWLVSMEMAAIFDFRALTKVHITSKPFLQMHEKLHTHRKYINEEKYTSVLVLLNINFFIIFFV